MTFDFDLFVIGGGSGGVRCARMAAGYGARVAIAEERFWGGTCVNVGCVPKKLLVQAGEYGGWADDSRGFGWDIRKGPHDWPKLTRAVHHEVSRLNGTYRRLLENSGATVLEARAVLEDANTVAVGGRRITAEWIVIATGGYPVKPGIPGEEFGILSDDAFALAERPARIAMIGAGYIAVEFAGIFSALGSEVDLVYRQPWPLRGFDSALAEQLAETMKVQGIRLHPGCMPGRVEAQGARRILRLSNGTAIETDLVFFATGRKPSTHGLGLDNAGIMTGRNGAIVIDDQMRTSRPNIFAIGDVTDRLNLTPVATAEGGALAERLFATGHRRVSIANVPTAVFYTPPLASVGLTEEEAAARGPADIYEARFTPLRYAVGGRVRRTFMKLVVDQASGRVLGAHMLGDDAPEIMQGVAIALNCGATKADFDRTIGIHPSAAEEFVTLRTKARTVGLAAAAD